MKKHIFHIFISFVILCSLSACSGADDFQSPGEPVLTGITLLSRASAVEANDNELINSYTVVAVDKNNIVRAIEHKDLENPTTFDRIKISAAPGTYTLYAFANGAEDNFGAVLNEECPDFKAAKYEGSAGSLGVRVPMSGFLENIRLPALESEQIVLELVRLWAKLQFRFSNPTSSEVSIKKITIPGAQTPAGEISLLPDYVTLGSAPTFPGNITFGTWSVAPNPAISIAGKSEGQAHSWYLLESNASGHPTGAYPISFEIVKNNCEETLHALAYQLHYVNRNDLVVIPVKFSDWSVELQVRFYPPIGGYPAVVVESKNDEFYAKFGSSGLFEIIPEVSDSNNGIVLAPNEIAVTLTVESGTEIFSRTPAWENGEIVGELAEGRTGTAVVNLAITVNNDALRQTFTRKLYIIRS